MPVNEEAHPSAKAISKVFPGLLKTARSWNGEVTIVRIGDRKSSKCLNAKDLKANRVGGEQLLHQLRLEPRENKLRSIEKWPDRGMTK